VSDTTKGSLASDLGTELRAVRVRYDKLPRGDIAALRRCRTADEVAIEGTYWHIASPLAQRQIHLPHVVLLFPLAPQHARKGFSFGKFLSQKLGDSSGAALRVRRLLDSRDRDDLDHRLRGILRLACADRTPIDWGVLGTDILWFFAESGAVRRRWAQDFYAPTMPRSAAPSHANA
jgi:CRISPR type I-E-associated protein CasB/Cse2